MFDSSIPVTVRPTVLSSKKVRSVAVSPVTVLPVSSRITEVYEDTDSSFESPDTPGDDSVDPDDLIIEDSDDSDYDTRDHTQDDEEHDQDLSRTLIDVSRHLIQVSTDVPVTQGVQDVEDVTTATPGDEVADLHSQLQKRIEKARRAALKAAQLQQQAEAEAEAAERELEDMKRKLETKKKKKETKKKEKKKEKPLKRPLKKLLKKRTVVEVESEVEPEVGPEVDLEVVVIDVDDLSTASEYEECDNLPMASEGEGEEEYLPSDEETVLPEAVDLTGETVSRESHVRRLFTQMPTGEEYVKPWGITDFQAYTKTKLYRNRMISQGCILDEDNNVIERPENYFGDYSDEWEGSLEQLQLDKERNAKLGNKSRDERARRRRTDKRAPEDTRKETKKKDTYKDTDTDTWKDTTTKKVSKVRVFLDDVEKEDTLDVILDQCLSRLFPAIEKTPKKRARGRPRKRRD